MTAPGDRVSRRRLLQGAAAAAAAVAAGGAGTWLLRDELAGAARGLYHRLADPPLPAAPPGELDAATATTLRAAAVALVGEAGAAARYAVPFRWRAAHRPGHLEVYRRFARFVDAAAVELGAAGFTALPAEQRRALLARHFPGGRLRGALTGWRRPQRRLLRRHVVRPILEVYAATDAWVDLGYGGWPGTARGLNAYRQPPPGAGEAR